MRKFALLVVLILVLSGGGTWFYQWWTEGRYWESTDNAYTKADITIISAKVPGIVEHVYFRTNESVKAGDILISMFKETFNAKVAAAKAKVAAAKANMARLKTRQILQAATISANQAEVRSAEAELKRARQDLGRAEKLKTRGFAEKQRYDHAVTDVAGADAELARTQANLIAARAQQNVLTAETEEIAAQQAEAEANLELAKIALNLSDIRAPREGVIANKHVEPGEYIQVGARKMAIVSLNDVWVVANFKETQLVGVHPGQSATVEVDAFSDGLITGMVHSLSPASGAEFSLLPPDNATGNFTKIVQRLPVKIVLDPDNPLVPLLRPGMSVVARVDTRNSGENKSDNRLSTVISGQ
jgi:membrane fusion protein, multidrug efflux system